MRKTSLVIGIIVSVLALATPAALAANLDTTWGTGGIASFPVPAGTTVTDTALLPVAAWSQLATAPESCPGEPSFLPMGAH